MLRFMDQLYFPGFQLLLPSCHWIVRLGFAVEEGPLLIGDYVMRTLKVSCRPVSQTAGHGQTADPSAKSYELGPLAGTPESLPA